MDWGQHRVKIALVSESFLPDLNGVASCAARTADCLVRSGHEVVMIAPAPANDRDRSHSSLPYQVEWIVSRPWPRNKPLRLGLPTPAVGDALRAHRPDALFLLNPYLMGGRALADARTLDIPAVALYFTDVEMIAGGDASSEARLRASQQLAAVHGMADVNLAPTRAAAADLAGHGVERVEVWAPGVDTEAFSPTRRSERLRAALAPNGELIVGYVGRLATEKQVDLLAGVAQLRGVRLLIVGQGPDASRLRTMLAGACILGPRRDTALARWYASLDVFAHPGAYETFGLTVREAQASGCAVVVPDAGGVACLVQHGVTGWLAPPHDGPAITRAIAALANDRAAVRRLGRAARSVTVTRSWDVAAAELVDHLRVAMDRRRR
jgi:phosphatidylinositol alpha 1,6-mannosyltransferase